MDVQLTWQIVKTMSSIEFIEDPVLGSMTHKTVYYEMYGPVLDQLDGTSMSDYFDFFFQSNPLNQGHWTFGDETLKRDFLDWCVELELIESFDEICKGETEEEKKARQEKEKYMQLQKIKLGEQKKRSKMNAEYNKLKQMRKSYTKLTEKLNNCTDPERKKKLREKIDRIIPHLNKSI